VKRYLVGPIAAIILTVAASVASHPVRVVR
jgi:hypothetical protein